MKTPIKKQLPAGAPEILPEVQQSVEIGQDLALSTSETDDVLAAGIDLGRLEAATFFATVADSTALSIYENVKKSKAWKHLRNPKSCDGRNFESLDEFCEVKLGKSYRRVQELSANRRFIGQEAFEQAERIGLRQVDYNAIKALPALKQVIVRDALADGASKEEVQRALRELAAADQKEIAKLTQERDDLLAEAAATQEVLNKKNQRIDKLELQAKIVADTDWPKALETVSDQAAAAGRKAFTGLTELEACRIQLFDVGNALPEEEQVKYGAALGFVADVYERALERVERAVAKERLTFDKTLGAYAPGSKK